MWRRSDARHVYVLSHIRQAETGEMNEMNFYETMRAGHGKIRKFCLSWADARV